jgi:acyl-CoA synthetase (AMP-forming)/AMP-acid ligase II
MSSDTIGGLIRAQAALGDRPFLVTDCGQITYAEAERRSRNIACALLNSGIGRGSHVALLYGNSVEFAISFLGITRIGAVALPLSTLSTAHEMQALLRGADVEYLLSADTWHGRDLRQTVADALGTQARERLLLPTLPTLRKVWFGLTELEGTNPADAARVATAEAQVSPADTLVIVHTSGSTSAPKGVVHTHGQVIRNMRSQNTLRRYTGDDRLFSNSPFFWIGGLAYSFIATLIAGARLVCSSAPPTETLDLLEAHQPTMCNGVASTVLALARDPGFATRNLDSLRRGNLYPIMPAAARPADPELRSNLLGATESGSVSLWGDGDVDLPEHKRGTFGRPVPGIEARVVVAAVDTDVDPAAGSNPVQDAEDGELWVRGPNVMQGYYGRERWQCFDTEGWFHTGDMMAVDRDGDFYFKGRGGDIIRTSGAQVSPREVEAAISDITGGRMCFVIGVPDPERGQVVTAVLVGDAAFDAAALTAQLKQRLSAYKVPRRFLAMSDRELPTLSSGKVDLKRLVERVRER